MRVNCSAPSSSNAFSAIDKYQRKNGKIESGLDYLVLLLLVLDYMVIGLDKEIAS